MSLDRRDPEGAIAEAAKAYSNWGRWGEDDVLGTLNFLDEAKRREGAALVRRGVSFSLSQRFDMNGPQKGWRRRTNPVHTMLDTGTDAALGNQGFPHGIGGADDPHTSLHHISFEMRGIDEYMRGSGRVMRAGFRKIWGPGRHMAGDNTFTYFLDPHGNTVEYTTELELLDEDTWHPHVYDFSKPEVTDQWGTANSMNELVTKESFNDVDRGVFVAPPV